MYDLLHENSPLHLLLIVVIKLDPSQGRWDMTTIQQTMTIRYETMKCLKSRAALVHLYRIPFKHE